ncbi:MAG: hypothetical protein IKC11_06185 [Clostridia bacterium]|nr:hypothetical protein [Clostridia bacterium]
MFIIMSGPSGSGKTPLLYSVIERFPNVRKIQSYTTRKLRKKEVNGTYIYLTKSQFEEKIKENFFLEYNKVHKDQQYYGTGLDSYENAIKDGCVAIKDIDVDSYKEMRKRDIDIVGVYVTVKNRGILFDRLRERGENEQTIAIRLFDRVDYENAQRKHYDYVIYTDDMDKAVKKLEKIVDKEFKKRGIKVVKNQVEKKDSYMF